MKFSSVSLYFSLTALGACAAAFMAYDQTVELSHLTQSSIWAIQQDLDSKQQDQVALDGLIELASNNRMASIVSYHLNHGMTLKQLQDSGYLTSLANTLKQDFIDDNIYSRLAMFNVSAEYSSVSSTEKMIREKWSAHIVPGSHFAAHPQGRLILPFESVDIPACGELQPYVAYVVATPLTLTLPTSPKTPTVSILEEPGITPQYRFELSFGNTPALYDTSHRILVDVGCTTPPDASETQNTDELTN